MPYTILPVQARSARMRQWALWSGCMSRRRRRRCTSGSGAGSPRSACALPAPRYAWSRNCLHCRGFHNVKCGGRICVCGMCAALPAARLAWTHCRLRRCRRLATGLPRSTLQLIAAASESCSRLHARLAHCRSCASWRQQRARAGCPPFWCRTQVGRVAGPLPPPSLPLLCFPLPPGFGLDTTTMQSPCDIRHCHLHATAAVPARSCHAPPQPNA